MAVSASYTCDNCDGSIEEVKDAISVTIQKHGTDETTTGELCEDCFDDAVEASAFASIALKD